MQLLHRSRPLAAPRWPPRRTRRRARTAPACRRRCPAPADPGEAVLDDPLAPHRPQALPCTPRTRRRPAPPARRPPRRPSRRRSPRPGADPLQGPLGRTQVARSRSRAPPRGETGSEQPCLHATHVRRPGRADVAVANTVSCRPLIALRGGSRSRARSCCTCGCPSTASSRGRRTGPIRDWGSAASGCTTPSPSTRTARPRRTATTRSAPRSSPRRWPRERSSPAGAPSTTRGGGPATTTTASRSSC